MAGGRTEEAIPYTILFVGNSSNCIKRGKEGQLRCNELFKLTQSLRSITLYSNFMAFISNKAISNRKKFAKQLRDAAAVTDFDSVKFLKVIHQF